MRALTLHEPWASLWVSGVKVYETRGRPLGHRGVLAVHAGKRWTRRQRELCEDELSLALELAGLQGRFSGDEPDTLGSVVGILALQGCESTDRCEPATEIDRVCGDWTSGRWALRGANPVMLREPVPCRGHQGLWTLPIEIERRVRRHRG